MANEGGSSFNPLWDHQTRHYMENRKQQGIQTQGINENFVINNRNIAGTKK